MLNEDSMLQKFKITSYAFILCLYGFTPITLPPDFTADSPEFVACEEMKWKLDKMVKKIKVSACLCIHKNGNTIKW